MHLNSLDRHYAVDFTYTFFSQLQSIGITEIKITGKKNRFSSPKSKFQLLNFFVFVLAKVNFEYLANNVVKNGKMSKTYSKYVANG